MTEEQLRQTHRWHCGLQGIHAVMSHAAIYFGTLDQPRCLFYQEEVPDTLEVQAPKSTTTGRASFTLRFARESESRGAVQALLCGLAVEHMQLTTGPVATSTGCAQYIR